MMEGKGGDPIAKSREADLNFANDAARKEPIAQAEEWRAKAMGTRKADEEKKDKEPRRYHHGLERQPEVALARGPVVPRRPSAGCGRPPVRFCR